jgi:hypothetical protein
MIREKEENGSVSSIYCGPVLAASENFIKPSRGKDKLVYAVSKFSFPAGRIVFVTNSVDFSRFYFYFVLLPGKRRGIPVQALKLPEG